MKHPTTTLDSEPHNMENLMDQDKDALIAELQAKLAQAEARADRAYNTTERGIAALDRVLGERIAARVGKVDTPEFHKHLGPLMMAYRDGEDTDELEAAFIAYLTAWADERCNIVINQLAAATVDAQPVGEVVLEYIGGGESRRTVRWISSPPASGAKLYTASVPAPATVDRDAVFAELRGQIKDMQEAAYTYGDYSKEAVRVVLDGVLDAIDALKGKAAPAQAAVPEGWRKQADDAANSLRSIERNLRKLADRLPMFSGGAELDDSIGTAARVAGELERAVASLAAPAAIPQGGEHG